VTDLLESPVMRSAFPDLFPHIKLVSSTPIRNMATLAGNFVNASPIGDMTVWFLALDAEIILGSLAHSEERKPKPAKWSDAVREIVSSIVSAEASGDRMLSLKDLYLGYKKLAKADDEIITAIRFRKPSGDFRFNFEKVCKRTYLDIATVNTAISLRCSGPMPGVGIMPDFLKNKLAQNYPPYTGREVAAFRERGGSPSDLVFRIEEVHVAAGGVAPIPLYLKQTSKFLTGREVNTETIAEANEIMQTEISPISDVRGTEQYKRLLLRQLFTAHFVEMFGVER
ncbi:MAG: FAD binding domain-containing protein, partial [Pyrinomonadaceae bacterium]